MARGTHCAAHKHSNPVSQERHHLQPQSRGGPNTADNLRWLCANAHGDTHHLLDLIEDHAVPMIGTSATSGDVYRSIPWETLRTYGPGIRNAAVTGWHRYGKAFLRGDYQAHRLLWSTSGQPHGTVRTGTWPMPYAVAVALDRDENLIKAVESWHKHA